jgi:hypothetical protein
MSIFGMSIKDVGDFVVAALPLLLIYGIQLPLLFFGNLLIMFGPLLFFGLKQMKGYEPGDADWGVKLADVRGQTESKAEVEKVIELWSAGRRVPRRRRQARARPALHRPAGHRQDDALQGDRDVVQLADRDDAGLRLRADLHRHGRHHRDVLIRKARRLARKWGDTCMVFHRRDRRRRHAPAGARERRRFQPIAGSSEPPLYGPWGSRSAVRRPPARGPATGATTSSPPARSSGRTRCPRASRTSADRSTASCSPAGWAGQGQLALNQLLVQMDGVDEPPFMRKFLTNRFNTFLDAIVLHPRKIGKDAPARQAAQAAPRAGLLHRRHERADRRARPGARAPGPDGPPHLVPHAH